VSEQGDVLRYLKAPANRGVSWTLAELAAIFRLPRRSVEQAVQALRQQGEPIVSDGNGIRWTDDPAEVRACADALRRRYISQAITARALKRTARRLESARELTLPW
jgi:biotin operon repressor